MIDTDANTNQVGYAEVEGRPVCTVAGIKGTFGIALNGTPLLIDPAAIGGQVKLDGLGNITGSETASYNGKITKNSPIYRNLLHQPRLHRNRKLTAKNLPTLNLNLTGANGENALVAIETDSGTEVSGVLQH